MLAGKWLNANVSCRLMEANWLLANKLFDLEIWLDVSLDFLNPLPL